MIARLVGLRKTNKIPILRKLKENTKIVDNGIEIIMDIPLPLDREDYEFLKQMHDLDISVKGRYVLNNQIIGFFNNSVKSIGSYSLKNPQLSDD